MEDLSEDIMKLMEGTEAHLVSDTSAGVMHDRAKVETPIPQLNCILGGGIPMGIIIEAYGEPASGKSSTWYQTMGNFQKEYPEGISIIVDTEASVDSRRMPFMGCDPKRCLRIPATTIESGFKQVFTILDKKEQNEKIRNNPVFIIWDTIGIGVTDKQHETNDQFSGGMLEKAKLLKFELSNLLPRIEKQPIVVVLLNQVTTKMGRYGSSLTSGGGWGLKHNAHLRLLYKGGATEFDGIYAMIKHSTVSMDKSKISPLFNDLSLRIDNSRGGVVDPVRSMISYATDELGYIGLGTWCNSNRLCELHPEYIGKFGKFLDPNKKFRYNELVEYCYDNYDYILLLMLTFCEEISQRYIYQAEVCAPYIEVLKERLGIPANEVEEVVPEGTEIDVITDSDGDQIVEEKVVEEEIIEE